jgi:hypothetical protein
MNKDFIFNIHIPKTGGSTFKSILLNNFNNQENIIEVNPKSPPEYSEKINSIGTNAVRQFDYKPLTDSDIQRMVQFVQRPEAKMITGHFQYGLHKYIERNAKYMTLLRHPAELIVSLYCELFKSDDAFDRELVNKTGDIRKFCELTGNLQTIILSGDSPSRVISDSDSSLNKAIQNIENHFMFAGVLEMFDEYLLYLKHRQFLKMINYKKINVRSVSNPVSESIKKDSELNEIIERNNSADIKLYNYCKDRFAENWISVPGRKMKLKCFKLQNKIYQFVYAEK